MQTIIAFSVAVVLGFFPISAMAFSPNEFGITLGSYHFTNDGSQASRPDGRTYAQTNPGLTAYFKTGSSLVNEVSVSYVMVNSYGTPSLYMAAYHRIGHLGPCTFDLAAAIATGYANEVPLARRFGGLVPLAGIRMKIAHRMDVDFIPAGLLSGYHISNKLLFTYLF